jgi:hypothetical protein
LVAAASVVEELRDFLSGHYADLIHVPMTFVGHGYHGEMPAAANDPGYAARIHNLKMACDAFCNAMRGQLLTRKDARERSLSCDDSYSGSGACKEST